MYLFDTSTIIDWLYDTRLSDRIDGPITASVLSIIELIPAAREKDKETLNSINRFFSQVKVLSIDEMISRKASTYKYELRRLGNDKPIIDLLIAATAQLNDLTLVTLDSDFETISNVGELDLIMLKD